MYRQILVHPDDQKFQLILWRDQPSQELSTFKLTTVTYGINSSPYLAIRTLHQLAEDEGATFPKAAEVLKTQTYVDDVISGADTVEDALELQEQLINLLRRGGFELRKWSSNAPELLQSLPQEHLETPVFLETSQQPHFSILGIHWSPVTDSFTYNMDVPQLTPTKRHVLSLIAKMYDPCGFLTPFIMLAKCFMQLLWTTSLDWDDPLPSDLASKWQHFLSDVSQLSNITIPRSLQLSMSRTLELHGFCDASESGYAAVVYMRSQQPDGIVLTRLVNAKSTVAPLKHVTLPRLELCGAHLLSRLVSYCFSIFPQLNPSDFTALTPGHFLIGAPLTAVPETSLLDTSVSRLKSWRLVQGMYQHIWKRWHQEYIHTLQQRSKWTTSSPNLKPGDLVLVHQPTPPLSWPLARITEVFPGDDGTVRVVKLKTQHSTISRPVVKVFPLPMN